MYLFLRLIQLRTTVKVLLLGAPVLIDTRYQDYVFCIITNSPFPMNLLKALVGSFFFVFFFHYVYYIYIHILSPVKNVLVLNIITSLFYRLLDTNTFIPFSKLRNKSRSQEMWLWLWKGLCIWVN